MAIFNMAIFNMAIFNMAKSSKCKIALSKYLWITHLLAYFLSMLCSPLSLDCLRRTV